jgi:two-component sensor histidine kinase
LLLPAGVGTCAVLQKASEDVAECLRRAAEAEGRADSTNDSKTRAEYLRVAETWRTLARSYEFQGSLGRFISFNESRKRTLPFIPASSLQIVSSAEPEGKADLLDRLAQVSDRIRPYSAAAFGIALASVAVASLLRFTGGWASTDLRFAIYLPAILATGLLAGAPAAIGAAITSIFIIYWAFMPPHFEFKWPSETGQMNILLNAIPYFITVYFAYLCRVILQRLRRSELNNRVLARELEHRGRNLFSVLEVIVQKSLADNPERANSIVGRLKSVRYSHELLTEKPRFISIGDLLHQEFAAYGRNRLQTRGPAFDIKPDSARHLILLFHELATNAAKYGSLSCPNGQVFVDWQCDGNKIVLTWKEHGGPVVSPPNKRGFGNQLIDTCIKSLTGAKHEEFASDGYTCTLTFKLAMLVWQGLKPTAYPLMPTGAAQPTSKGA